MFLQQAVVCSRRHGLEVLRGYGRDDIDDVCVGNRQLHLFLEVTTRCHCVDPNRIVLQEGRRNEELLQFHGDTICYVFVRELEEVVQQPQVVYNRGSDGINEFEEGFEDVGEFGELDDIEGGVT